MTPSKVAAKHVTFGHHNKLVPGRFFFSTILFETGGGKETKFCCAIVVCILTNAWLTRYSYGNASAIAAVFQSGLVNLPLAAVHAV